MRAFSTGYSVLLLIHILAVVVAFGPNFVQPLLARSANVSNDAFAKTALYVQLPALVVVFVAGMGMVGMSDNSWQFSQSWVSIAFLLAIAAGVLQFLIGRAYQRADTKAVPALTGGLHLLLVVAVYLMIWKPGT